MKVDVRLKGMDTLLRRMRRKGVKVERALGQFVTQEAESVMTLAKEKFVPVDLGTLRSSGFVSPPMRVGHTVGVKLGFGGPAAPYALMVHENPRAGKTQGISPSGKPYKTWSSVGQWKYLEKPLKMKKRGRKDRLKLFIKRIVDRV